MPLVRHDGHVGRAWRGTVAPHAPILYLLLVTKPALAGTRALASASSARPALARTTRPAPARPTTFAVVASTRPAGGLSAFGTAQRHPARDGQRRVAERRCVGVGHGLALVVIRTAAGRWPVAAWALAETALPAPRTALALGTAFARRARMPGSAVAAAARRRRIRLAGRTRITLASLATVTTLPLA